MHIYMPALFKFESHVEAIVCKHEVQYSQGEIIKDVVDRSTKSEILKNLLPLF